MLVSLFVRIYGMLTTTQKTITWNQRQYTGKKTIILLTTAVAIPAPFGADAEPRAGYLFQNAAGAVGKPTSFTMSRIDLQRTLLYYPGGKIVCKYNTPKTCIGACGRKL